MKIPIIILPKFKKFLFIENNFVSKNKIIPIGCDCHPAYMLSKLNLRKSSMPFDWLNTDPVLGIQYVFDNFKSNFNLFLEDLVLNEKGNIISKNYPNTEFLHEKDLIENPISRLKFSRRIERFLNFYLYNNCFFLYNVTSQSLDNSNKVIEFTKSIEDFSSLIKKNDKIFIYIRYDESFKENVFHCEKVYQNLQSIDKVSVVKYIRYLSDYGGWGNEKKYYALFQKLGINLKLTFPKIYFK